MVCSTTLAFFKHAPLWSKLSDVVKAKMWLIATENVFPECEMAIDGICSEILEDVICDYEEKGLELEASMLLM